MTNLSLVLALLISIPSFAEEIPGKTLLSYFAGSCKSSSTWTQAAIADSEALIKTLNAMTADPDCASAAGAISQLNNLSAQVAVYDKLNDVKNSEAAYNAEEQQLLIQLTKTTDVGVIADINAALRNLQIQRAKLLSNERAAEKLSGADKVTVLGQIAMSANSSFQQITSNQKCIDKHPNLLTSATSIVAGVGSAVTLVNPAIGIAMTAGSTFVRVAVEGIKSSRNARRVRNISDDTISFEAYSCALESMSDRWCQMVDADSFLKFKSEHRRDDQTNPGLAQAISLNDREIPIILDWLNKVRNGVAPRTTADAGRRETVLTRELIVRAKSDHGLSLLEQNRKTYDSLAGKPDDQQYKFLRTLISTLAPQGGGMGSSGPSVRDPLDDIYADMYSPYYLIGLNEDDPRIRENCQDICPFSSWPKPSSVVVTLDSVKAKYQAWIDRATDLVNRELSEVQQPDPLQTLSSANMESEPWMITPLDAFQTIADFLEKNPPGPRQGDFKKLYADTLAKLRKIHDTATVAIATGQMAAPALCDAPICSENGCAQPVCVLQLSPIEEIYDTAQLKYGIVVLQARLELIVRLSLLEYIKSSPEEDQILLAQLLASDRFYQTISSMNGTTSYARLREDIKKGKAYTMKNLEHFMDIFGHNINRTLRTLRQEELRTRDRDEAQANRDLRTQMCFLVLGAVNVADHIDISLCSGLKMNATETGGPESITINAKTFTKDLGQRACTYREFFRESDIYQKWNIRN
ncbi:MAG: hypothetical protein H0V66_13525 [Bdellovibrionales bacterium]|nr:hypothetical protein [Bdellovibrionales bacterium]